MCLLCPMGWTRHLKAWHVLLGHGQSPCYFHDPFLGKTFLSWMWKRRLFVTMVPHWQWLLEPQP